MSREYNPSFVSKRTRSIIIDRHYEGHDDGSIAAMFNLKPSTIKTYIRRWEQTGSILTEYEKKKKANNNKPIEHNKLLDDPEMKQFLQYSCLKNPTQTLDNYVSAMMAEYGIYVSKDTIDRMFKKDNWKWKKISSIALESDPAEQASFWELVDLLITDKNQMIFLDESNRSNYTANPTHARGPAGPVYVKVSFTRGGYKFSLLIVTYYKGVLCHKVFYGSVNEERFNDFIINELSKYLNPYPQPQSVIMLDNIPFHKNRIFAWAVNQYGCIGLFLPRYTPRYNLAEYAFRDIKSIEKCKNIYTELEGLISLEESVEAIKNKNYSSTLKQIGYIK